MIWVNNLFIDQTPTRNTLSETYINSSFFIRYVDFSSSAKICRIFNIPKKDEPKDKEEEVVAEELIQEIFRIKDIMKKIL